MASLQPSSRSTADGPAPGDLVAGRYLIERPLGAEASVRVFRARQVTLGRDVDLTFYDPGDPEAARLSGALQAAIDHPAVPAVLDAGASPFGSYVAKRAVDGVPLGQARGRVVFSRLLHDVAAALTAAHSVGLVHGALDATAIIVQLDGRVAVSGFRPSTGPDEITADDSALRALVAEWAPRDRPPRSRQKLAALGGAAALVVAGLAALLLRPEPAPPAHIEAPLRGAFVIGSRLPMVATRSFGCDGKPASVNSQSCTIAQFGRAGLPLVAPRAGRVIAWATRGATGDVALQVFRRERGKRWIAVWTGPLEPARDARRSASVDVRRGDRFALLLGTGAGGGVRPLAGATTGTWTDQLSGRPRPPVAGPAGELQLRVELSGQGGGADSTVKAVTGPAARAAAVGEQLDEYFVELRDGRVRRVLAVRLGDKIYVDMFAGSVRVARLQLPDADSAGHLVSLGGDQHAGEIELHWAQPQDVPSLVAFIQTSPTTLERGFGASKSTGIPARPSGARVFPGDSAAN